MGRLLHDKTATSTLAHGDKHVFSLRTHSTLNTPLPPVTSGLGSSWHGGVRRPKTSQRKQIFRCTPTHTRTFVCRWRSTLTNDSSCSLRRTLKSSKHRPHRTAVYNVLVVANNSKGQVVKDSTNVPNKVFLQRNNNLLFCG